MNIRKQPINSFLGLMTQYDASQVPLGGAIALRNIAMLEEGRLRKTPGITALGVAPVDMELQIPLLTFVKGLGGLDYTLAVGVGVAAAKIVNLTTGAALTGAALVGAFGGTWTHTYYILKHIIAGGGNTPKEINAAGTYIALAGTSVPTGNLVQSFLDRLYVSGISTEEGLVRYSDVLTTNFPASNLVNTKEVPGAVTSLGILSAGTASEGIDNYLVICKRNAMWAWNEVMKKGISQKIGTESPHTWVPTQVGPIFLGKDGNRNSVFLMPSGTVGEPKDIGRALHGLLNSVGSTLSNASIAYAAEDQGFYKLIFAHTGHLTVNYSEVWLDLTRLASTGEVVWYGPHYRGGFDAMVRTETRLELARRGGASANVWFNENADTTQNFVDADGGVLESFVDLPLNTEPFDEEKIFEVMELQIAKEANRPGNSISVEVMAEDISQGSLTQSIYDGKTSGVSRPIILLYPAGTLGFSAKNSRVRLSHNANVRFDLLGATVQYLYNEEPAGRVKSRI